MINQFFASIHHAIFSPIKSWAELSTSNWNLLIGIGFLLVMGSAIFAYVMHKKMGPKDERTKVISLKSAYWVLAVIILCDIIFPKEDMWTIYFLYKYGLAFLAGGIYLVVQYRKDFV